MRSPIHTSRRIAHTTRVIANERGSAIQVAAVERNFRDAFGAPMTHIVKAIAANNRTLMDLKQRFDYALVIGSGTEKRKTRMKRQKQRSGAEGNRTLYLLHAMQALSQMSYGPCLQLGN
jgi:hypothetical protein